MFQGGGDMQVGCLSEVAPGYFYYRRSWLWLPNARYACERVASVNWLARRRTIESLSRLSVSNRSGTEWHPEGNSLRASVDLGTGLRAYSRDANTHRAWLCWSDLYTLA